MGLYHTTKRPFSHSRRGMFRTSAVGLLAVALVLGGCGTVDDDGEATAESTVDASGTLEITDSSPASSPAASSTAETSSTPVPDTGDGSGAATPAAAPELATPASPVSQSGQTPVAGRQRPPQSTEAAIPDGVATPSGDADSGTETASEDVVDSCDPDTVPEFSGDTDAYVVAENLNFRTGPGVDCDPIGESVLASGTGLTVTSDPVIRDGDGTEWVRVEVEGQEGWVAIEFIEPEAES